jgi:uncharacterized protein YeaO (DUF488 family)
VTAAKPAPKSARGFRIKRIYEPAAKDDGLRVLVDRLWPRGLTKEKARLDLWLKEISPSDVLRHLVHDDPTKWDEFVKAYDRELAQEPAKTAAADLRKRGAYPAGDPALRSAQRNPQQCGRAETLAGTQSIVRVRSVHSI